MSIHRSSFYYNNFEKKPKLFINAGMYKFDGTRKNAESAVNTAQWWPEASNIGGRGCKHFLAGRKHFL